MRTDVAQMTLEEIRVVGLKAITDKLGPIGLVRFLQMFETGKGDYSEDRHEWINNLTVEEIYQSIQEAKKTAEWIGDPDAGLELRSDIVACIERQRKEYAAGKRGKPLSTRSTARPSIR